MARPRRTVWLAHHHAVDRRRRLQFEELAAMIEHGPRRRRIAVDCMHGALLGLVGERLAVAARRGEHRALHDRQGRRPASSGADAVTTTVRGGEQRQAGVADDRAAVGGDHRRMASVLGHPGDLL